MHASRGGRDKTAREAMHALPCPQLSKQSTRSSRTPSKLRNSVSSSSHALDHPTCVRVCIFWTYSRKQVSQKCAESVRKSVRGSKGSRRAETILAEGPRKGSAEGFVFFIENPLGIKTTAHCCPRVGMPTKPRSVAARGSVLVSRASGIASKRAFASCPGLCTAVAKVFHRATRFHELRCTAFGFGAHKPSKPEFSCRRRNGGFPFQRIFRSGL